MSAHYTAELQWERGDADFLDGRYPRRHTLHFDGGAVLPGSSSPHSVPLPYSDPAAVDPEELLVGATAACHMLWFLALAARRGYRVDRYADHAAGEMRADERGKRYLARIVLRPRIEFSGPPPDAAELAALHADAHAECYIANSLRGEVVVEGQAGPKRF